MRTYYVFYYLDNFFEPITASIDVDVKVIEYIKMILFLD